MSLQLLLMQYASSLNFDVIEDYQYQVGDIIISKQCKRIVDPLESNAFHGYIIRNIDIKEETEIFVNVSGSNKVIQSNGKCRQHKNFGKIIKVVNDMKTQNQ